jgi:hypothetical protein
MNSIAQHAVPKGYGHKEPFRAQLMSVEAVVVKKFSRSEVSRVSIPGAFINL